MNKVILMGRLTRDPEITYSNSAEPLAICRYSLAVNKRFKRDGEPDADFINCVAFGKTGEFAERYFTKGQMVSVVGRLQVRNWEDQNGQKRTTTEVVVEEQFFAESRKSSESNNQSQNYGANQEYNNSRPSKQVDLQSVSTPYEDDGDLPF